MDKRYWVVGNTISFLPLLFFPDAPVSLNGLPKSPSAYIITEDMLAKLVKDMSERVAAFITDTYSFKGHVCFHDAFLSMNDILSCAYIEFGENSISAFGVDRNQYIEKIRQRRDNRPSPKGILRGDCTDKCRSEAVCKLKFHWVMFHYWRRIHNALSSRVGFKKNKLMRLSQSIKIDPDDLNGLGNEKIREDMFGVDDPYLGQLINDDLLDVTRNVFRYGVVTSEMEIFKNTSAILKEQNDKRKTGKTLQESIDFGFECPHDKQIVMVYRFKEFIFCLEPLYSALESTLSYFVGSDLPLAEREARWEDTAMKLSSIKKVVEMRDNIHMRDKPPKTGGDDDKRKKSVGALYGDEWRDEKFKNKRDREEFENTMDRVITFQDPAQEIYWLAKNLAFKGVGLDHTMTMYRGLNIVRHLVEFDKPRSQLTEINSYVSPIPNNADIFTVNETIRNPNSKDGCLLVITLEKNFPLIPMFYSRFQDGVDGMECIIPMGTWWQYDKVVKNDMNTKKKFGLQYTQNTQRVKVTYNETFTPSSLRCHLCAQPIV